ncbi:helix-turn-helix domain-containing protein [Cohnella lupini]|uniref:Helix-turn-helix protein n=1 Tax=Cohnella lupini TaxID=1294267 RepID=A0A3D9I8C9_9BACL|nr:helix-turn-helix transcriptional regulator [Cohnella lupini]RED58012.1 helix-turn-helix protein [Cohnella lupini]
MDPIKDRLRHLRRENGLTMAEFASKISVSPGNVGDWESEQRPSIPGAKALIAIAQKFNVSLDWLLLGQPETGIAHHLNPNPQVKETPSPWEKNSPGLESAQDPQIIESLMSAASQLCRSDKLLLVELAGRLQFLSVASLK